MRIIPTAAFVAMFLLPTSTWADHVLGASLTDILAFRQAIVALSEKYQFFETSGRRTEKRNRAVGGNPHSLHLSGLAVDIVLDNHYEREALVSDVERLGLVAVPEEDHMHIQSKE